MTLVYVALAIAGFVLGQYVRWLVRWLVRRRDRDRAPDGRLTQQWINEHRER